MNQWTPEQRKEAVELGAAVGKAEAARRLGIPAGSIGAWMHRAGIRTTSAEAVEKIRPAIEHKMLTTAERKAALAERLAELAHKATAQLAAKIDADEVNARDLVSALTAAVDRLQLLTGEATQRTEATVSGEPVRERLLAAVSTLAERRVA